MFQWFIRFPEFAESSAHLGKTPLCRFYEKINLKSKNCLHRAELEAHKPAVDKFVSAERTGKIRGVILTLKGSKENGCVDDNGEQYDFVSRYFAPWVGINEDPVTGK